MESPQGFTYPWEYNFPPFFTIQPNLETRRKQLEAWRSLIIEFCVSKNIHQLNIREWLGKSPFANDSIDRRLTLDALKLIMNSLSEKKFAEWTDKQHESCIIYWRPPAQWGQIVYDYVKKQSLQNSVLTFYELLNGDETKDCEFHGMDEAVFLKAIRILERDGKAAIIELDGSKGVKFV
ncbi:Vacuolar protein-sorting-associated protein 25, partial [Fragariocoptes setiger]